MRGLHENVLTLYLDTRFRTNIHPSLLLKCLPFVLLISAQIWEVDVAITGSQKALDKFANYS
ncbi:hypothetical protein GYH30_040798 [Glycine max]|uniref:Uncharacterized protein n=1 Tax=Glycine max TaxID=3847 RepID=A0A0R0GG26_SOYBN|nr:hypothetical protein GYH30_040798 [Glycine max]